MQHLINRLRAEMENVLANSANVRAGIVDTYDPKTYTCVVRYQPENKENPAASLSPSLPIKALAIGNGFGILCPPNIGDQVVVEFVENSNQVGFVLGALFNNFDVPPATQAGGFYLIHQTGSFLKFTPDGKVSLNGQVEIDITAPKIIITATGNVEVNAGTEAKVTAPSIVLGDGNSIAEALTQFASLKAWADGHFHPAPGGDTGVPTVLLPTDSATTIVKGA